MYTYLAKTAIGYWLVELAVKDGEKIYRPVLDLRNTSTSRISHEMKYGSKYITESRVPVVSGAEK